MFVFEAPLAKLLETRVHVVMIRLPPLSGRRIRIEVSRQLSDGLREVHAGSFVRERRIAFDHDLLYKRREFARIFVHELFHFVWVRLGNPDRRSYERMVLNEIEQRARGELGWSAEWRKQALSRRHWKMRHRRWREYVCESFCDSAAWMFAGLARHPEFTLAGRYRERRRRWFQRWAGSSQISI